ncbi:hypothetical protein ACFOLC_15630 [Lysobacter cavernae]|uniref:Uncharacterized protein n=1 Tax=Lysobacter cavernae TaxID=1685901 RepID=A0ABV7RSF9_9GAMM
MNIRKWIILAVCVLAVIALVLWLGDDSSDEGRDFLRALRHVL